MHSVTAANKTATCRLIVDSAADGVSNMAFDEALLQAAGRGSAPPTLRFYQWDPPTVSLGYFQKYTEFEALPPPAGDLAVVRRTTGGGAILHDREWTYSLALPANHEQLARGAQHLYEVVHDALIDTLLLINVHARRSGVGDGSGGRKGPFFCFERRHCLDVLIEGRKLAGSAQRRGAAGVLQHGSIMLSNRYAQHPVCALDEHIDFDADSLLEPLQDALARRMGVSFCPGEWSAAELESAADLKQKYAGEQWLCKY